MTVLGSLLAVHSSTPSSTLFGLNSAPRLRLNESLIFKAIRDFAYTLWLFTYSDLKTVFFPTVSCTSFLAAPAADHLSARFWNRCRPHLLYFTDPTQSRLGMAAPAAVLPFQSMSIARGGRCEQAMEAHRCRSYHRRECTHTALGHAPGLPLRVGALRGFTAEHNARDGHPRPQRAQVGLGVAGEERLQRRRIRVLQRGSNLRRMWYVSSRKSWSQIVTADDVCLARQRAAATGRRRRWLRRS